ncbi:hypothetical protein Tco_1300368 [Tanacetum coccineum]
MLQESRPPPERVLMKEDQARLNPGQSHVVLAGPNLEPMHEDFVAIVYTQVHESLKHTIEEHAHIENPLSSSGTLLSMKNLDDGFTFGDQFLNDKPTKEEPGKANVETEVKSMVTVPIHQASSSAPLLSTPIINLIPPKPDQTTQALSYRVYTLENHDLYSKIDKYVNDVVKEAVHNVLKALVHERFIDLTEFEMKEIIRDRMFESGSYRSHLEHTTLYEALEASMDRKNKEKFNEEMLSLIRDAVMTKILLYLLQNTLTKARRKGMIQILWLQNSLNLRSPQLDDEHFSDLKDTDAAHLPKIKTKPDWLKPVPKEDTPETPEPDWVVPPNDLLEAENNWANTLAKTYKDPEQNKLLWKTRDMGSFIKWYCRHIGKSIAKLLRGPAFKIDLVNPEGNRVVPDVSKPLPLGGPQGDKERRNALSISKLKVANYLDFGLEELVPSLWIESERDCNISASYGISHWWFKRKEFYITRHSATFNCRSVRSHMRILSVVSLKTFLRYDYTYLREIILRRADYKEYKISEVDFKNLHPNDFEDLYLLHLQGKLNHLSGADKVHLFNAVNL